MFVKGLEIGLVALGGALGAMLRYKLSPSMLLFGTFPIHILIVNILGSLILGLFMTASHHWNLDSRYTLLVATGFTGSLTTMSAFAMETVDLFSAYHYGLASINIVVTLSLSFTAIIVGKELMRIIINF